MTKKYTIRRTRCATRGLPMLSKRIGSVRDTITPSKLWSEFEDYLHIMNETFTDSVLGFRLIPDIADFETYSSWYQRQYKCVLINENTKEAA